MYERLLDKSAPPSDEFIRQYLGEESYENLLLFEKFLRGCYDLKRELRFPFGNGYGWGYKYSHKSSHLCYAFFESGAFTVTLQLGDACVPAVEKLLPQLSAKANELWQNRYPCGERGGCIHHRITSASDLDDICKLVTAKKRPVKKKAV